MEKTTAQEARPADIGAGRIKLLVNMDFDSVVRDNSKRLFNLAWHMLGNFEESEELVQEIFLEAYASLPGYKGDAPVGHWLYRIAMNVLADHISAKKRKPGMANEISFEDRVQTGLLPASENSAESEFMRESDLNAVRRAVLGLPARYRAVFVLNVVEGRSHKEIAQIMGMSPGAVRVTRVRAARMIRKEVMKHGLTGGGNDDEM